MTRVTPDRDIGKRAGFTLMEVAIAIVVLAIGVLSVFGLMGAGLNNSNKAVADTHIAMFADSVMAGLRAESIKAAEQSETQWYTYWNAPTTSVMTARAWGDGSGHAMPVIAETGNSVKTLVFTNFSFRATSAENIVNYALRYKLNVEEVNVSPTPGVDTFTYHVTLKVWDGQFGRTEDANAFVFYTEFSNLGNL